ncbi:MAG: T9SS type A sorting domain-containing protein [Lewinellaceae bacterium]|nr:T9SS type A sorting domain-containing protein [Lewinellaceae bacterium]
MDHLYTSYIDDFDGGDHREIGIKKIDTLGNEVWSKNYNTDIELSYAWEISESRDSNIFISAGFHYYNKLGRYAQLTKIDTSGNILWTYKGDEAFDNGAVPTWIAELSNGDIVITYYIHGVQTPDIKLIWINKDGHYYKEKLIDVTAKDEFYFNQLEAGHGDYFFAYGFYRFFDDKKTFGILTKYDNDGSVIWKHLYQHPDYTAPNDYNSIKDIEELENGDIVVLGDLRHPGNKNEIWLYKINADGCYGTDDCPEEIILSAADEENIDEEIRIYPNPAQDIMYIATHDNVKLLNVTLIAIDGKVISEAKNIGNTKHSMDVSAIDSGIYFINVSTEDGKVFTRKVIVD